MSYLSQATVVTTKEVYEDIRKKINSFSEPDVLKNPSVNTFYMPWDKDKKKEMYLIVFDWRNHFYNTELYKLIQEVGYDYDNPERILKACIMGEDNACEVIDNSDGEIEGLEPVVDIPDYMRQEVA